MAERTLKIFVLPSWYPPNEGAFFEQHSQALTKKGAEVTVLAVNNVGPLNFIMSRGKGTSISKFAFNQGIKEYRRICLVWPKSYFRNIKHWIEAAVSLYENVSAKEGQPDFIQVHSSMWAGAAAAQIKKKYGVPYVLTEHRGRFIKKSGDNLKLYPTYQKDLLYSAFKNADHLIAVSNKLKEGMKEYFEGEAIPDISLVPNMVNTEFFDLQKEKGRPADEFTFFFLGELQWHKGVDLLIKAFYGLLHQKDRKCRLIIGGEGKGKRHLMKLIKHYEIEESVSFTGKLSREEVKDYMQFADGFVLPSRYEAFGVVLLEAMASGLPVVATKSGGPEDFVPELAGYLIEPGDDKALMEAMNKMVLERTTFKDEEIAAYVRENFSPQVISEQYLKLYKEILFKG